MGHKAEKICIWSGPVFALLMIVGGGLAPQTPPAADAASVVAYYQAHLTGIQLSAVLLMISAAFYFAYTAAIAVRMKQIEGRVSPLTYVQLITGTVAPATFVAAGLFWTIAAFRLDRAPEITQALNDLGWMSFAMPGPPATFQLLALGFAIVFDKNGRRILPRWLGHLSIWAGISLFFGVFTGMAKIGPFAWTGAFPLYLPFIGFTLVWLPVMTVLLLRTLRSAPGQS